MSDSTGQTALLEAGRAVDAPIARLLGHVVCDSPADLMLPEKCALYGTDHFAADDPEMPHYSTEIAAAWPVLEWLLGRHYSVELYVSHESGGWRCSVDFSRFIGFGDTPALAICHAALDATRVRS